MTWTEPIRGWLSLAGGWALAVAATFLSTQLSLATGLIFHFHPIAIAVGAAWLYRTLNGERPCTTHGLAFLFGLTALLAANASALRPIGLTDPDVIAVPIAIAALAGAAWVMFRHEKAPVAARSEEPA